VGIVSDFPWHVPPVEDWPEEALAYHVSGNGLQATITKTEATKRQTGLVASSLRRSELRERAKGKGPDARVARMISDQREGRVVRPL
jgi:hypothetical protein